MTPTVRNFLQFVMRQPSDKKIKNYDDITGKVSFKFCAIGSFIKEEFNVSDEDWDDGFKFNPLTLERSGVYQIICDQFLNELYDDSVYSDVAINLERDFYETYGDLKRSINES